MVAVNVVIATTGHNCLDAEAARELMIVLGFGAVVLATEDRVFAAAAINPPPATAGASNAAAGSTAQGSAEAASAGTGQPAWARRLQRRQQLSHAATTVAHTLRGGDGGGAGSGPSLRDPSNS